MASESKLSRTDELTLHHAVMGQCVHEFVTVGENTRRLEHGMSYSFTVMCDDCSEEQEISDWDHDLDDFDEQGNLTQPPRS